MDLRISVRNGKRHEEDILDMIRDNKNCSTNEIFTKIAGHLLANAGLEHCLPDIESQWFKEEGQKWIKIIEIIRNMNAGKPTYEKVYEQLSEIRQSRANRKS